MPLLVARRPWTEHRTYLPRHHLPDRNEQKHPRFQLLSFFQRGFRLAAPPGGDELRLRNRPSSQLLLPINLRAPWSERPT